MTISELTPLVVSILSSGALITAIVQRKLIQKQADNAVVEGATGVIDLYRTYTQRLDQEIARLTVRLEDEERRCNRLEAALKRAGIIVEGEET